MMKNCWAAASQNLSFPITTVHPGIRTIPCKFKTVAIIILLSHAKWRPLFEFRGSYIIILYALWVHGTSHILHRSYKWNVPLMADFSHRLSGTRTTTSHNGQLLWRFLKNSTKECVQWPLTIALHVTRHSTTGTKSNCCHNSIIIYCQT